MGTTAAPKKKIGHRKSKGSTRTAKQVVRNILDAIPDDVSFEDIQYHIYVRQKIETALQDIKAGRLLSEKEVEQRMAKWFED